MAMDHFSDADLASVKEAMNNDAELKRAVRNWIQVSRHIQSSIQDFYPPGHLLVMYALRNQLDRSDWTEAELALAAQSEVLIANALERHPSIVRILDRIEGDATAFNSVWDETLSANFKQNDRKKGPLRDRSALPLQSGTMRLVRLAISVAAVITFVTLSVLQLSKEPALSPYVIESMAGEVRSVTLDDGTTVRMGPSSTLSWEGEYQRSVTLSGAAYFDVVASPRSFEIHTPAGVTTVLGTEFGVQTVDPSELSEPETIVTLVSGRVSLSLNDGDPSNDVVLTPGNQGVLTSKGIRVSNANLLEALSWSELIIFRDTPMKDVKNLLSKRFEVTIEISKTLDESLLTGTFEQERGVREILDIVAAALGATLNVNAETGVYSLVK